MKKSMFVYSKMILERVSFDPLLFCRELEKALKSLLPYEVEKLKEWLQTYTIQKPELKHSLLYINKYN